MSSRTAEVQKRETVVTAELRTLQAAQLVLRTSADVKPVVGPCANRRVA
jgi:hypothetical protein